MLKTIDAVLVSSKMELSIVGISRPAPLIIEHLRETEIFLEGGVFSVPQWNLLQDVFNPRFSIAKFKRISLLNEDDFLLYEEMK